ncbi:MULTISPECIES: Uma2 family endonuclease [Planktothrix]|uniref:Putative restriction endonuclease domain-containing protein n=1 Tax=Planktothrix rubescens CCAP 1459/22 TaxID=329571 RepID=A0A6J7ZSE7_PLARU|nr:MULTISPECIES: Uma2 family endonuclease [Planktothrix]CAC5345258.1 conserved hypothetical protein [Planktothrix rubescens NIVA-CYA 18]CAD5961760.1 hypothetical protein PCC7821_03207 [Planktothrix rubescens NIVA-CYA 18]
MSVTPIQPPTIDLTEVITEDDSPVDNFLSAKLQRLLVECLYSSWQRLGENSTFLADANVGIFYALRHPPIVPDVFLSLDVEVPPDFREKRNRTYFIWEFGKPPDVVIEIVSNQEGNELGSKLINYARMRVTYYVVFDPLQQLGDILLRVYVLREGHYQILETTVIENQSIFWLEQIGLGLTIWSGIYEEKQDIWLRWCDDKGVIIPTGKERAEKEHLRAEIAEQSRRNAILRLREMGLTNEQIAEALGLEIGEI